MSDETAAAKLARVRKQFSKDVCQGNRFGVGSICRNKPPETTNFMNACLSCRLLETCRLLFVDKGRTKMEDSKREERDKNIRRIDALLEEGQNQEQVVSSPTYAVLEKYGYPHKPCFLCMYSNPSDNGNCLQRHWMDQCNLLQLWEKRTAIDKQQAEQDQYWKSTGLKSVKETKAREAERLQEFEKWFAEAKLPTWFTLYTEGYTDDEVLRKKVEKGWEAALIWVMKLGMKYYGNDFLTDMTEISDDIRKELGEE